MRHTRTALLLGLAALLLAADDGLRPGRSESAEPRKIVQDAFDRMFNYPSVRSAELHVFQHGERVTQRAFDVVYRKIDGQGHTLLRFTDPEYLRGTSILMVERADGSEDVWLYREAARRVRRVSTSQRDDSFYGTDFTFEDLEHHDWSRFDVRRLGDATREGRAVQVLEAIPMHASQYGRLRIEIEKERGALLRLDLFRPRSEEPSKSLQIDPETIEQRNAVLIPRRMRMEQHGRDAHTEVRFSRVELDTAITKRVFTSMALERSGVDLFGLVQRLGQADGSD